MPNIPFVDLKSQYRSIKAEIDAAIQSVLNDTAFVGGKYVEAFEQDFASKYGVKHCISCANGTDAIFISLKAAGIRPGDEVITAANTFIATSEAISLTGARPVFVDIDEFYHLDPARLEEKITPKTRAAIPVHLYGQPADLDHIKAICDHYNLIMIEDCAQSHFAAFNGQKTGTFGLAGTFSFYPGKNLGAYGDGGAIITNNDDYARRARLFANHGSRKKYIHEIEGINSRLDGLQAAILSVKLKYIDDWNQARFRHALKLNQLLSDIPQIKCPNIRPGCSHIFHIYCIRVPERERLIDYLKAQGIATNIHYPYALPFTQAYAYMNHKPEDFPTAYSQQSQILSLPMYPELSEDQIEYISDSLHKFYSQRV
ncbi:MAG: DegT/DnrJ/EryC1/StrS family aminotransferase [Candidatus Saccharicenans sp.]|uniref:DegT/DnrJ/EryC1/StrS family aminotransferase n=1 Tax=Candidatus Saccharicenans sp. TaxID=2819258 RepID=UPI00404B56E1